MSLEKFIDNPKIHQSFLELLIAQENEWKKSIKKVRLTEEVCEKLLRMYINSPQSIGDAALSVKICSSVPPCDDNEEEQTTRGRKWCKSRSKYGSKVFDEEVKEAYNIYKSLVDLREKRIYKIGDKKELMKNLQKENEQLDSVQEGFLKLFRVLEKEDEKNDEKEKEKNEGNEEMDVDELESYLAKAPKPPTHDPVHTPKVSRRFDFKAQTKSLQEKKAVNKIGSTVMSLVRDSTYKLQDQLLHDMKERLAADSPKERAEAERQNIDTGVNTAINSLSQAIKIIDQKLENLEKNTQKIDTKQEKILSLTENIRERQELAEYANLWYKSKLGVLKKILLSPVKALNIIIWKPAKYAFWHFFGKYFYLIWGLLMLFLIIVVIVSTYKYLDENYAGLILVLQKAAIKLWGAAIRSGSSLAEVLRPFCGETIGLFLTNSYKAIVNGLGWMLSSIIGIFQYIINNIVNGVVAALKNYLPSLPKVPSVKIPGIFRNIWGNILSSTNATNSANSTINSIDILNETSLVNSTQLFSINELENNTQLVNSTFTNFVEFVMRFNITDFFQRNK